MKNKIINFINLMNKNKFLIICLRIKKMREKFKVCKWKYKAYN